MPNVDLATSSRRLRGAKSAPERGEANALFIKTFVKLLQTEMANEEHQEEQRDRRAVSAGSSDQVADADRVCCHHKGKAQGETPGQTVLEAAQKHYEKD